MKRTRTMKYIGYGFTIAILFFAGCQALTSIAPSDPTSNAGDPTVQETADNPATSPYYTEPNISYGAPGDGLSDLYDTSSTYLASYNYNGGSSGKGDAVTLAVQSATQSLMSKSGIVGTGTAIAADGGKHVMVFASSQADAAT